MTICQPDFLEIDWDDRRIQLEFSLLAADDPAASLIVFLHEGLGSLSLWKDFPARLCNATGCRGLIYSRPGYGQSTPFAKDAFWGANFMHRQAFEVLPMLLVELNLDANRTPIWLFGHSDGASIALLYSARFPNAAEGLIAVAPHIMVEDVTVKSIRNLKTKFRGNAFQKRFAMHHADPESTFDGWSRVWLDPKFREWSIESELGNIQSPALVVQGADDEYGTGKQVTGIITRLNFAETYMIQNCGHAPHRSHADALLKRSTQFIRQVGSNQ